MATLLSRLPAPVHNAAPSTTAAEAPSSSQALARVGGAPPYGSRASFVPRKPADFGDGGAYPECHVAQYPLDCGRKGASGGTKSSVVNVHVDEHGALDYSAIVTQGTSAKKTIATKHNSVLPRIHDLTEEDLARPDQEQVDATLEATRAVIEARVNKTMAANQPKSLPGAPAAPQYIKYTPAKQGPEYNSGASHRIIKMHEVAVDPLQPPKFAHKKVPRGPGSPPVPVMHSPPRTLSAQDQADWKIPACVSNWKNTKGYTIPLDKRLAADGRGLLEVDINDNFAKLSESLYIAEAKAREAVETRAKIQRELLSKEKERKEEELRQLAQQARMVRAGAAPISAAPSSAPDAWLPPPPPLPTRGDDISLPPPPPLPASMAGRPRAMDFDGALTDGIRHPVGHDAQPSARGGNDGRGHDDDEAPFIPEAAAPDETPAERAARLRRDEIREERRRERERERRLESLNAHGAKRSKITRDRDRDVSERMALGQANVGAGRGGEALYDQRLFNQDAGLDSGFGADDTYNTYSKPLFADRGNSLYAPGRSDAVGALADAETLGEDGAAGAAVRTDRFKPDRAFAGAEPATGGAGAGPSSRGSGPVVFERPPEEDDPFGLGAFISDVRRGGKAKDAPQNL